VNLIASFRDVSFKRATYNVVDDITFDLEKGSITTLIGPNGAGKSTIAKLLLGIKNPSQGTIKNKAKAYSYVPQKLTINPDLPINSIKLLEFISPNYASNKLFSNLMDFIDIDNIKNKLIQELSGGQLQRLLISSAILRNSELLVLDEPTQCLDIDSQNEFYRLLKLLKSEMGVTIFLISHDLFTVMDKTDQVLCLNHHLCCKGRPTHTIVKGFENIGIYSHKHDHKHG